MQHEVYQCILVFRAEACLSSIKTLLLIFSVVAGISHYTNQARTKAAVYIRLIKLCSCVLSETSPARLEYIEHYDVDSSASWLKLEILRNIIFNQ